MKPTAAKILAASLLFLLPLHIFAQLHGAGGGRAQIKEGLGRTWKSPAAAAFTRILTRRTAPPAERTARSSGPRPRATPSMAPATPTAIASIKFRPGPDTGIGDLLATAITTNAQEKAVMSELFRQLKSGYETEVAKEGKSNDLAAAMTFFVASNVVAYHNSAEPSDAATEDFYNSVREVMAATPEIARLTDAEKQQTHDWLVYMGGLVLLGHMNAKNTNDRASLADYKAVADQSMRLVLGVGPGSLTPNLQSSPTAPSSDLGPAPAVNDSVIGIWTAASSSPAGTSMVTSAGLFRGRYTFAADGSYQFKSERQGLSSNTWWNTEESGSYTVYANLLTITPRSSVATLRNLNGAVQKTQNNPLEKVTYKWTTHYFSGINETNLVLEPPQKTSRDGAMGGNSLFPRAYLYKQGDDLAWRY